MKICAAQLRPLAGDIDGNIARHLHAIRIAAASGAALLLFPELSLTGYEPNLASRLAFDPNNPKLDVFQACSDRHKMTIAVGLPTKAEGGVRISLLFFTPGAPCQLYSKQVLHEDEFPYFLAGTDCLLIHKGGERIAPAICYESLQGAHAADAARRGASVYLASVAKTAAGVEKAQAHYPTIAKKHGMHVLMANSVGPSDNFVAAGGSAAWSAAGVTPGALGAEQEGLLLYDLATGKAETIALPATE